MTLVFSRLKQLARCLSHSKKPRMYINSMCRTWSLRNIGLSIDPVSTRENAPLSHFLLFCMYNLCYIINTSQALNSLEAWWHLCTHITFALNGQHAGFHLSLSLRAYIVLQHVPKMFKHLHVDVWMNSLSLSLRAYIVLLVVFFFFFWISMPFFFFFF